MKIPHILSWLLWLSALSLAGAQTSVRDFGAVGDGVTDDTAAIARAVAESKGGLIVFPRGNFLLKRTIEIHLDQRGITSLTGQHGIGRVTMAAPGPAFRFIGTHQGRAIPGDFKPAVWEKERMPQVEGLEIVGAHSEADGVEFIRVMQPTLRAVLIREVRDGVRFTERIRNVIVIGCHIYNCRGIGVYFNEVNMHQAVLTGNHISFCKGGGIKIVGGQIRNFQITGNDIEYNYDLKAKESADIWFDVRTGSVSEGTIAGNTIQGDPSPGGANIRFIGPSQPVESSPMGLWTISGNLIGNQTVNLHLKNCKAIAITGNQIYTGVERTILLEDCRHVVIGSNTMDQSHNRRGGFTNGITVSNCDGVILNGLVLDRGGGGDATRGGAVEILGSRETIITGCQLFEPIVRGIYVADSRNTTITSCQILDRQGKNTFLSAVQVDGKSTGTVLEGNTFGCGTAGDVVGTAGVRSKAL